MCLNSITLQRAAPPWVFGFRFRTSDSSFSFCCLGLKLHTSESSFPFWFLVAGCTPQRAASLWVYGCRLHISNGAFNRRVHTSESSCLLGFWLQASHLREQLPFCFVFWVSASHLREQLPFGFWSHWNIVLLVNQDLAFACWTQLCNPGKVPSVLLSCLTPCLC